MGANNFFRRSLRGLRLRNCCCEQKIKRKKKFSADSENSALFLLVHASHYLSGGRSANRGVSFASKGNMRLALQLVTQSFLMPVRLHPFAALMFGNFCFPSFFKGAHSDLIPAIRLNHLIHRSASVVADSTIWFHVMALLLLSFCPARQCRFSSETVRSIACGPGIFRSI